MTRTIRTLVSIGCAAGLGLLVTSAAAQAPAPAAAPAPVAVQAAPVAVAPAAAPAGDSDQALWVGRLGLGWYGTRNVPYAPGAALNGPLTTLPVPAIGVRYWINPMIGIDGALGFYMTSGSRTTDPGGVSRDKDPSTGFLIHGGLPIALLNMKHYSFQITPEVDVGFGSQTNKAAPAVAPAPQLPDTDNSGMLIQIGARAGAEIFFGFVGLPQLSLDASVGLFLASQSGKSTTGPASTKDSTMTIATVPFNAPWDIFTNTVAARYYF